MNRRQMIALGALAPLALQVRLAGATALADGDFAVTRTAAEWRARLSDAEYEILREAGTEPSYSSPLNGETRDGTYLCRGCAQPLYASETKFNSGTGWPSFYRALPDAVGTQPDRGWFMTRTEVHCSRCGSHQGHVFDDGPPPTGKRHCINGLALTFEPAPAQSAS